MNIENLVPPLALCMKLSEKNFAYSIFVWYYPYNEGTQWDLIPRSEAGDEPKVPAPTLQEIIPAIVEAGGFHPEIMYKTDDEGNGNHWEVECFTKEDPDTVEDFTSGSPRETDSINPATAALKLWLRLAVKDGK